LKRTGVRGAPQHKDFKTKKKKDSSTGGGKIHASKIGGNTVGPAGHHKENAQVVSQQPKQKRKVREERP